MNKAPKIGMRVHVKKGHRYFPCAGVVTKIWPALDYDDEGFDWDSDGVPPVKGYKPEREWSVSMKVNVLPKNWAYVGSDTFCPVVAEIELESGR